MEKPEPEISLVSEDIQNKMFFEPIKIESVSLVDLAINKPYRLSESFLDSIYKSYPLKQEMPRREFLKNLSQITHILNSSNVFNSILCKHDKTTNHLSIGVQPKSFYFLSFSQNYSSRGKISLNYEIGLRNVFKHLDLSKIKFEQKLQEGNSIELSTSFPYFYKTGKTVQFNLFKSNLFLCEDVKTREASFGISAENRKSDSKSESWKIETSKKNIIIDSEKFPDCNYEKYAEAQKSITGTYISSQTKNPYPNFFSQFETKSSVELNLTGGRFASNGKLSVSNYQSVPLRKILPGMRLLEDVYKYYMINLEMCTSLSYNFSLRKQGELSVFHRNYFARMRGFSNVVSNHPFSERLGLAGGVNSQWSFQNSIKLNFNHFPIFQNSSLAPFWHSSVYMMSFNSFARKFMNWNFGVGLNYKLQENVKIELIYNFFHLSLPKSSAELNKEENFQIRLSFND